MLTSFEHLKQKVVANKPKFVIAVAAAADAAALSAICDAERELGVDYVLIGDKAAIIAAAGGVGFAVDESKIIQADSDEVAAEIAVGLVRNDRADVLMKGKLQTGVLMKAVVDKENGIRRGGLMSHLAVLESPFYHKLIFVTDGGMVPTPDLAQKRGIAENAVGFLRQLGYSTPKVAALAAVETVSDKMQETVDAAALAALNRDGEIGGCVIDGPISIDLAVSAESAKIKGFESPVAGDADIFLAPGIAAGNIMAKTLIYLGNAKMAGCVLGAKVPIILVSRGASAEEKMLSILLAVAR